MQSSLREVAIEALVIGDRATADVRLIKSWDLFVSPAVSNDQTITVRK